MIPVSVYPPLEDSLLLAGVVSSHATGKVLDVGCGSGIQSQTALKNKKVKSVLGVDINPVAVKHCKATVNGAKFIRSDLFFKVPKSKFDTILFNPPYLPQDGFPDDPATIGGKEGWETIERFLFAAPDFLSVDGKILLLFTSRTNKDKVHELINGALLDWTMLATNHIEFETYYVYALTKNSVRKDSEKEKITSIHYLAKGKRGLVFRAKRKGKNVVLKINNPSSTAFGRLANEARILNVVNKKGIGPKLIFSTENVVCCEFIDGVHVRDWLPDASQKSTLKMLSDVLKQCFLLDTLGLQKEEMHHPHKHIIVGKKSVLIDFERGHHTERPHNVTQFCQYISSLSPQLAEKKIFVKPLLLRRLAANYARVPGQKTLDPILALL